MAKYRKKPVVVDAWQWPREANEMPAGAVKIDCYGAAYVTTMHDGQTVELEDGDYVIPEPDGEHFYPSKQLPPLNWPEEGLLLRGELLVPKKG